jgi:drug/metabolite transporter (DMT)-like permease
VFTKLNALDGLTIAFYRGLFAGLVLVPLVPRSRREFRPVMVPLGLVFGAMTGLFLAAMKATTAANTIYLQYTATFWLVPLGMLFLGERPDRRTLLGVVLAMAGIALIVAYGHRGGHEWAGIACGLGSGLGYAVVATGMRGLRGLDPVWLSGVNNLAGAMTLGLWMTATYGPPAVPNPPQAVALAAFGIVQMAIPYVLFARGLREVTVAEAGLIALVEPILNPLWVALAAHEFPGLPTLLGGALLLAGVACRYLPAPRPLAATGQAPAPEATDEPAPAG